MIIGLFNLFFKCDSEESRLWFKSLFKMNITGFWIDKISWWLFILDSWELLISLCVWIVSILDIIGGCDFDIILFPIFFSKLLFNIKGGLFILFVKVLILLIFISLNVGYLSDLMELFFALENVMSSYFFSIMIFTHEWIYCWVWFQIKNTNLNSEWYCSNFIIYTLIIIVKYIMWRFGRKWYQFIVIRYVFIWNECIINYHCRNGKGWKF